MYSIKANAHFDSARFLAGYHGRSSNIHGHRWTMEVEVASKRLSIEPKTKGMVTDFGSLQQDLHVLADRLDYALIVEQGTLKPALHEALKAEGFKLVELPFRPTVEQLAQFVYEQIKAKGYRVVRATVYETPETSASYTEE